MTNSEDFTSELTAFVQYLVGLDRSEKTVSGYKRNLEDFKRWFEGTNGEGCQAEKIAPADIREYRQYLQVQKRLSGASVNRSISALKAFLRWAKESGKIAANPADGIKLVRKQKLSPKWLEKREAYALERETEREVQTAKTSAAKFLALRDRAMLVLFLNTGLRVSELVGLQMGDIQLSERKGSLTVRLGKGEKQRVVPLNEASRRALREWLEIRGEGEGACFRDRMGKAMTPSGIHRRLAELGKRAGVELHAHLLRHTFAKRLVDSGVGLEKVGALLGHSDLNTTRVYVTPGERDLEKAVEVLE